MSIGKNWCFTLQADESKGEHITWACPGSECPVATWFTAGDIDYLICQVEKGTHVHLQGYVQFKKNIRMAGLKKINNRAWWELRKGTHAEARDYCKKVESHINGPWECGTERDAQGKRTDLESIGAMVKARKTNIEIVEECGAKASKFAKHIQFLRFTYTEKDSDRQLQGVRVLVLYGATGTGKTYAAVNYIAGNKDYYICEAPSHSTSKVWFDGYEGQRTLILDDFAGSFCQFRFLLRLLDVYKLKVEVKGGHAWAVWTTVVITSNIHPSGWYEHIDTSPLRRRINEIRLVEERGAYKAVDWTEHVLDEDFVNFDAGVPATPPPAVVPPPAAQTPAPGRCCSPDLLADFVMVDSDEDPLPSDDDFVPPTPLAQKPQNAK